MKRMRFLNMIMIAVMLMSVVPTSGAAPQAGSSQPVAEPQSTTPTIGIWMARDAYGKAPALDARWSADYGRFVWLEVPIDRLSALDASGLAYTAVDLTIGVYGYSFDPRRGEPDIPADLRAPTEGNQPGLRLVQFAGPIQDGWLKALWAAGLKPLQYYAHNAYLAWGTPAAARGVEQAQHVRWVGDFQPAYKINPQLHNKQGQINNVAVTFYNDGDLKSTLSALGSQGRLIQYWATQPDQAFYTAILTLDAARLAEVAKIAPVWAVEYSSPEPGLDDENATQIVAGNYVGGSPVTGYYDWLTAKGVNGAGVTWADVDTGINPTHPDFTGRVIAFVTYPGAGPANTDTDGHGTHTAGAIIGDGLGGTGITDPNGFYWGTGMAPSSTLVAQNALMGTNWPPTGGWNVLSRDSVLNGAAGSSNSWYTGNYDTNYTAACREHDQMVRDAVFTTTAVAEPIIYVFSAGNGGPNAATLSEPHASKNPIIVGASSNYPRSGGSINDLADFSSRGPAADGRRAPSVAAPGWNTVSLNGSGSATCGSLVSGAGSAYYNYCSGTSMACPLVAGSSALIVDWWQQEGKGVPSPAMVKALLVNGADDMVGGDDGASGILTNIPNNNVGWGRVNLNNTIRTEAPAFHNDQQTLLTSSGESWQAVFIAADQTKPVKVSLVWTDAPGAIGANPALVNDLNLTVVNGGNTYLGNDFSAGWSTTGGTADALNNIENVFLPAGTSGAVNITVDALNIAGDGVPYNGDDTDQDFALVCYNCYQIGVGWLQGTVYDAGTMAGLPGVNIQATGLVPTHTGGTTSGAGGAYLTGLLSDTYTVTASLYGYFPTEIGGIDVISGTTTTQDIPLTMAPWYEVSGYVTNADGGWPVYASVDIDSYPYGTIWTDRFSGYYTVSLPAGVVHDFSVTAANHLPANRGVGPLTGPQAEDFALQPDFSQGCPPGYTGTAPACTPFDSGRLAGFVYDDNTGLPMSGVLLTSDGGFNATSAADGFYELIETPGAHTITATTSGYAAAIEAPTVVQSATVQQDFYLPAGQPTATPPDLAVTVGFGLSTTTQLSVGNIGAVDLFFELKEQGGGYIPSLAVQADQTAPSAPAERLPASVTTESGQAADKASPGTPASLIAPEDIGAAWETMAPLPSARVFNGVVAEGPYVYVVGGTSDASGNVSTDTLFRYDTNTNVWDTMASLPASVMSVDAVVINGKMYVPGDTTGETYVYNIATNAWSTIAVNGGYTARAQYQAVAIGSDLYVLGGIEGSASTTEVWILDTATGTWSAGVPMQNSRTAFAAGAIDGVIYVAGGVLFPGFTPDMTSEKFEGGAWSYIADVPNGGGAYTRWSYNADAIGETGLWLAGGRRDAGWAVLNHAGYYDPAADAWTDSPTIPTLAQGRVYMEGDVAEDGYLYVIGGRDSAGSVVYDTNERLMVGYAGGGDVTWLSEQPVSSTVSAGGAVVVDVTFDSAVSEVEQPGDYYATLNVTNDSPYGALKVPVTMTVEPMASTGKLAGVVTGLGYCDVNPAGLDKAEVFVESATGMSWTLTTNASGAYSYWIDEMYSPLTVSVSYPNHTPGNASGVVISGLVTTTQNFDLRLLAACVDVTADTLEATFDMGMSTTLAVSITNSGAIPLNFEFKETNEAHVPALSRPFVSMDTVPVVSLPASVKTESGQAADQAILGTPASLVAPEDIGAAWETMAPMPEGRVFNAVVAEGPYVYVIGGTSDASGNVSTDTLFRYNTGANTWDTMASMPAAVNSIDAIAINGKIYVPGDGTAANTYVYDIATNAWSTIAANGGYTAREQYQVAAIGSDLYVLGGIAGSASTTEVWVLNTSTGVWSAGVPMQNSRTSFAAGAIGDVIYVAGGVLFPGFTPDMTSEKFEGGVWSYVANVPNGGGAYTRWSYNADAIGETGLWLAGGRRDAGWAVLNHAGYYDPEADAWTDSPTIPTMTQGRVYMEGDVAEDGYLYVIGGRDSAGSVVYDTNERLMVGYAGGGDIIWLSEDPVTGTLPADTGFIAADITLDSIYLGQPGTYYATLRLSNSDPVNGRYEMPVTMTINVPATYGKLQGSVYGLLHCDAGPAIPVNGAEVLIQGASGMSWTIQTDASGAYGPWWLDESETPLTISVLHPDYSLGSASGVTITGQQTTTVDFPALRLMQPCVSVAADVLETTQEMGLSTTLAVTLSNSGAAALDFDFSNTESWLYQVPVSGSVAADGGQLVADVVLDSAGVLQPGVFYDTLNLTTNDPVNSLYTFPATMTTIAPASWGLIDGNVTGLGYCDAGPSVAVAGASVLIEGSSGMSWTLTTEADGGYGPWWLDSAESPLSVSVTHPDYTPGFAGGVAVTAQQTTTVDFLDLRLDAPCVDVQPLELKAIVGMGVSGTVPLTISNSGAGALAFELKEKDEGYTPSKAGEDVLVVAYDTTAAAAMETALTTLGYTYLQVTRPIFEAMAVADLLDYSAVFYTGSTSGDSWAKAMEYLDNGGSLYISDNDLGYSQNATVFYQQYLQATYVTDNGGDYLDGEDIMAGLNLTVTSDPYPDGFTAGAEATRIFVFNPGGNAGGVLVERNGYAAIYTSFDFDDMAANSDEVALVDHIMGAIAGGDVLWLSENPASGSVAADGGQTVVDVVFDAAMVSQPGNYYASLTVRSDDPVNSSIELPVTMTVQALSTTGLLKGNVTGLGHCDAGPALPIADAEVLIESATGTTWTLTTDVSGTYGMWINQAYSPLTITLNHPAYESGSASGVVISGLMTTTVDFLNLRWLQACIEVVPPSLHEWLDMGMTTTVPLTFTNNGAAALDFELSEKDQGYVPTTEAGEDVLVVDEDNADATALETALTALGYTWLEVTATGFTGMPIADMLTYKAVFYTGFLSSGSEQNKAGEYLDAGGRFLNTDDGFVNLYCTATYPFCSAYLQLTPSTSTGGDGVLTGVDIMAGINPDLSAATSVDDFTFSGPDAVGIFRAPTTNWSGSLIERNDYKAVMLGWDFADTDGAAVGNETVIVEEVMNFFAGTGDVPWLSESLVSATLPANGGYVVVDVTFDTISVTQPGDYLADITVKSNDPVYDRFAVPVIMTLNPSADYGLLEGSVIDLGYCDGAPVGVNDVDVFIWDNIGTQYTATTYNGGYYAYWFDQALSPFTITVDLAEHESGSASGVIVTGQQTTTVDFNLRWLRPCQQVQSPELSAALAAGMSTTLPLTLTNNGASDLTFKLVEKDEGFIPLLAGEDLLVVRDDTTAATAMETALTNLGYTFLGVTETAFRAMTVDELLAYNAVLYAGSTTAGDASEALLIAYLDAGGALYISDNDQSYAHRTSDPLGFCTTYLQSTYIADNGGDYLDGEDIMAGLNLDVTSDPYPDSFTPGAEATRIFVFNPGGTAGGVLVNRNGYQAIYTAFDFDDMAANSDEEELLSRVLATIATSDVLWLSEVPVTGTLAADGGSVVVNVTLDAAAVSQAGDYFATLRVSSNDPAMGAYNMPVTMTRLFAGITWNGDVSTDWYNAANWTPATVPTTTDDVLIPTGRPNYPLLEASASIYTLIIQPGASVTIPAGFDLTAEVVDNQGTLSIQKDVPDATWVNFSLFNATAQPSYLGVDLMPAAGMVEAPQAAMGLTWVEMRGHMECTTADSGDTVNRCVDITPSFTNTAATVRIYYLDSELDGLVTDTMRAWHWNNPGWTPADGGTWMTGTVPGGYYVEAQGVTGWSPFTLTSNPTGPTAITLQAFAAHSGAPVALLVVVGLVFGLAVVATRKRMR